MRGRSLEDALGFCAGKIELYLISVAENVGTWVDKDGNLTRGESHPPVGRVIESLISSFKACAAAGVASSLETTDTSL